MPSFSWIRLAPPYGANLMLLRKISASFDRFTASLPVAMITRRKARNFVTSTLREFET
ncbi:hypothetical protein ACVWXO_000030 [Bradyrhizobium sp. LM2.7]